MHRLLGELLAMVPPDGSDWPRPARQRWITALGALLDVLYEDGPFDNATLPGGTTAADTDAARNGDGLRPDAAGGDANHPMPSEDDVVSVLDLRTSEQEPSRPPGKHARPSATDH